MRSDSFASSGEALAKINTYRAANGCNTGIKLPAIARLTMMMENSPRASKVNPVLSEPTVDNDDTCFPLLEMAGPLFGRLVTKKSQFAKTATSPFPHLNLTHSDLLLFESTK